MVFVTAAGGYIASETSVQPVENWVFDCIGIPLYGHNHHLLLQVKVLEGDGAHLKYDSQILITEETSDFRRLDEDQLMQLLTESDLGGVCN